MTINLFGSIFHRCILAEPPEYDVTLEGSLQNPYLMSSYGNVTHCNRDMLRLHMEHSITEAKYPIQPDLVPDSVASTQTSLPNFPLTS